MNTVVTRATLVRNSKPKTSYKLKCISNLKKKKLIDYPSSSDISEIIKKTGIKLPRSSRSKKVISDTSMSKTIDGIMFVGFDPSELTELPGFQEAPQLLNNLSLKMNYKVYKKNENFNNYFKTS